MGDARRMGKSELFSRFAEKFEIKKFCPVCRYALVDFIDPTMHGEIDRDYERIYPD